MRILRVAQKVYPDAKGGGAYHVHAMSRDQATNGHEVTVLTVGGPPLREHREGYTVIRKPPKFEPVGNAIAPGIANHLRKADAYDVIHAHSHLYFSTNLAALARRLGEIPLAITNHGLYSQTAPRRVFTLYLRTLGRWSFNQADVVFTYTSEERDQLRSLGVSSAIKVVSNGIDTERFTPDGHVDARIESPAMLFVGRLVDGKRPVDAVRALAGVREQGIDATLYVAGEGPLKSAMQAVSLKKQVEDAVVFLGHVPYEEMPGVYRAADVLVLPSRDEGLPRTVLEAMASGTPVVASDLPQLASVLDSTGRTVPVGNIAELTSALVSTLTSGPDAGGSDADGSPLPERFEWRDTVEQTTRGLERLVSRDNREP